MTAKETELTRSTADPSLVTTATLASTLALGLALAAPGVRAQSEDGASASATGITEAVDGEMTALEELVLLALERIGITDVRVDKLSSGQLAGILMTLTATDRQDKEEAVTAIVADADHSPGSIDAEAVAGNETVRATVEAAIARAGLSIEPGQLSDAQVAALFAELARAGDLQDGAGIRDFLNTADTQ